MIINCPIPLSLQVFLSVTRQISCRRTKEAKLDLIGYIINIQYYFLHTFYIVCSLDIYFMQIRKFFKIMVTRKYFVTGREGRGIGLLFITLVPIVPIFNNVFLLVGLTTSGTFTEL